MEDMSSRKCSKPLRMWIDGKCYNVKKLVRNPSKTCKLPEKIHGNTDATNELNLKMRLPFFYMKKLLQFKNASIERIGNETETHITFPKYLKDCNNELNISGHSQDSIDEAKEELHSLIAEIREKEAARQFISIRLLNNDLQKNFENFKTLVLAGNHRNVEESIFQKAAKLHLTVNVFCLVDESEKKLAVDTLEECRSFIFRDSNSAPMKIKVQGVHSMNDNPSKVDVLYADAALTGDSGSNKNLQEILNLIQSCFYEKGLVKGYQDNVKVHMTLMNTKYRNSLNSNKRWQKRIPFDATKIIEQFGDYTFGEVDFDSINLSSIQQKDEDGFYKTIAFVKI